MVATLAWPSVLATTARSAPLRSAWLAWPCRYQWGLSLGVTPAFLGGPLHQVIDAARPEPAAVLGHEQGTVGRPACAEHGNRRPERLGQQHRADAVALAGDAELHAAVLAFDHVPDVQAAQLGYPQGAGIGDRLQDVVARAAALGDQALHGEFADDALGQGGIPRGGLTATPGLTTAYPIRCANVSRLLIRSVYWRMLAGLLPQVIAARISRRSSMGMTDRSE